MRLQTKFLAVLMPAGLLTSALMLILIQRTVHSVIIGGLERGSTMLAVAASQHLADGMAKRRELDLLPDLQNLQREEGALYAEALDPDGKVVAHTNVAEKGRIRSDEFTRGALLAEEPRLARAVVGNAPALLVSAPIWSAEEASGEGFLLSGDAKTEPRTRLGTVKVAVPLVAAQETERRIIRDISLIVLLIGAVAFASIVVLVRRMLAPIGGLMSGIARIGRGEFDVAVPVLSADELGDLAESFNIMSGELGRTTVSKDYFEGVLENMNDLLVVADPSGSIQTLNRAAAAAFGDGRMIGRPLASLFTTPPEANVLRDVEVVLRTKDGETPALFSSSALHDREGRLRGYIGVAKDITARKRAEEALLSAKLAAEASNKELETFSYSVAHDLRAPLRAIDGFSQLLLSECAAKLDDTGRDYLARVRTASRRMGALIDDLLNLSRISRGQMRADPVDLSALARAVCDELEKGASGRKVEFVVAPGLKTRGDENLLRLALSNIIGNSWKYTSKHPSARIEFGALEAENPPVYFVRDDGAGFDMALASRLFEPFTRLHASADFEGTGIGLATVHRIITRHGGRVWAESAVERGATFYFTLWETKP